MKSPSKISGPALTNSPFQQLRSVSIDCKRPQGSPRDKENMTPNTQKEDLLRKIKILLEENEKQEQLIQKYVIRHLESEQQHSRELEEQRRLNNEERELLVDEHSYQLNHVQELLQERCQSMHDQIAAYEEHISQLLEHNTQLSELVKINQIENIDELDAKIDYVLDENAQLKEMNDKLQDQLTLTEEQLFKYKLRLDEQFNTQETERKEYAMQLNQAKCRIRKLETKVSVLSEDNHRFKIA